MSEDDIEEKELEQMEKDIEAEDRIMLEAYLEEQKKAEERRKKFENLTMKDIENAMEILEYFLDMQERATAIKKKLDKISPSATPEQELQRQLLRKMGIEI